MYYHITQKQRIELALLRRLGNSIRATARILHLSHSSVSRELQRNISTTGRYHAGTARLQTRARRTAANQFKRKLTPRNRALVELVESKLRLYWSPEQIAGWLQATRHALRVSAQTIYDWLYTTRRDLLVYLRSQKQKYRRTRANTLRRRYRDELFAARRIDRRPAHVLSRSRYGHWEGDTMVSRSDHARLGTLVERKSGYLRAFVLPDGQSRGFALGVARALETIPKCYKKTLTLDNGTEMQSYELLERLSSLQIYFAFPYHSWERGSNENTNGLLRQYFPKKTSLAVSQAELDKYVQLLNTRPRKRLGYRTPAELFETKW